MAEQNPITERLAVLSGHWLAFTAQDEARMARWVITSDSLQMVQAFLAYQQEESGDVRDLFIRFEVPFEEGTRYGFALRDALAEQMDVLAEEEAGDAIADGEPFDAPWRPPDTNGEADDCKVLGAALASFHAQYADLMDHLVVVLAPLHVSDVVAWQAWLLRLVQEPLSPALRFLVLDRAEAPLLDPLSKMEPARMLTTPIDLNMADAYNALAQRGDASDPGVRFRQHFVALTTAIGAGDLPTAEQEAQAALAIAEREAWLPMQVAVHLALGGGYLGQARFDDALHGYRTAQAVVRQAPDDDPVAPKLLLQARLAEGAALFGAARYAEAAPFYEATAPLAEAQDDGVMTVECWRMAAYCYERIKRYDDAWRCSLQALDAGTHLDDETRPNTTLPYVGQAMLRLTKKPPYRGLEGHVEERLTQLVGPDWQARNQEVESAQVLA